MKKRIISLFLLLGILVPVVAGFLFFELKYLDKSEKRCIMAIKSI